MLTFKMKITILILFVASVYCKCPYVSWNTFPLMDNTKHTYPANYENFLEKALAKTSLVYVSCSLNPIKNNDMENYFLNSNSVNGICNTTTEIPFTADYANCVTPFFNKTCYPYCIKYIIDLKPKTNLKLFFSGIRRTTTNGLYVNYYTAIYTLDCYPLTSVDKFNHSMYRLLEDKKSTTNIKLTDKCTYKEKPKTVKKLTYRYIASCICSMEKPISKLKVDNKEIIPIVYDIKQEKTDVYSVINTFGFCVPPKTKNAFISYLSNTTVTCKSTKCQCKCEHCSELFTKMSKYTKANAEKLDQTLSKDAYMPILIYNGYTILDKFNKQIRLFDNNFYRRMNGLIKTKPINKDDCKVYKYILYACLTLCAILVIMLGVSLFYDPNKKTNKNSKNKIDRRCNNCIKF